MLNEYGRWWFKLAIHSTFRPFWTNWTQLLLVNFSVESVHSCKVKFVYLSMMKNHSNNSRAMLISDLKRFLRLLICFCSTPRSGLSYIISGWPYILLKRVDWPIFRIYQFKLPMEFEALFLPSLAQKRGKYFQ